MDLLRRSIALTLLAAAAASAQPPAPPGGSRTKLGCGIVECPQSVFNAAGEPPLRLAYDRRLPEKTVAALRRSDLAAAFRGLRSKEVLELVVLTDPGLEGAAQQQQAQHRSEVLRSAWRAAGLPADRLSLSAAAAPPGPARAPSAR